MTCYCESCRPVDPAPTYTEQFKLECLARHILATKPAREDRRAWLAQWRAKHGEVAEQKMREIMLAAHRALANAAQV